MSRSNVLGLCGLVFGAAVAAGCGSQGPRRTGSSPSAEPMEAVTVPGFTVASGQLRRDGDLVRCVSTSCTLRTASDRSELLLSADSQLRVGVRGALTLVDGAVKIERPRRAEASSPLRIQVSHGVLELAGTRAWLRQERHGGEAWLLDGRLRFTAHDGRAAALPPGKALVWPLLADRRP
ncbi:MAG: hypothetical protein IT371_07535 [Deltaproteobacteria bacterium]|nr:hypothetical protein [Deltaproteobacteria bacterium]